MQISIRSTFFIAVVLFISLCTTISLTSCSNEDTDLSNTDIVGTWYGTRAYNNPVSGTKYQYITILFGKDGTGTLEYESPVSYSFAKFTYSVKKNIITCNGVYANTYGDTDSKFTMKLRIDGNRLIPLDMYDLFILTKDNSVITDGDGNELIDDSVLLYGVWLHSSGEVVLVLDQSSFTEYTLMSASSNIYSNMSEGSFSYNILNKYVLVNGYRYDICLLSETALQLKSEKNVILNYIRGNISDIPTNGENSNDYRSILENALFGWSDKNNNLTISFYDSNKIMYIEKSSKPLGSWGYVYLEAKGTYSLSEKTIECTFTDVTWQGGNSSAKDYFPGWTYMETCRKDFTILNLNVDRMTLSQDGKTYTLYRN